MPKPARPDERTGAEPAPESAASLVVGSTNPAKLDAVARVAGIVLPGYGVRGVDVESGVGDQPRSDEETLRGAEARAAFAMRRVPSNYAVGIESGVARFRERMFCFTWVAVVDSGGAMGRGCSARLELPDDVAALIERGLTLEAALVECGAVPGIGREGGAMGRMTGGIVTRADATIQALHFAFARFANKL
jgi:inosine/xanthosine triphosphatase